MTTPFSADDLVSRSILGSLIGFSKKKNKNNNFDEGIIRHSNQECIAGCSFRTSSFASSSEAESPYLPSIFITLNNVNLSQSNSEQPADYSSSIASHSVNLQALNIEQPTDYCPSEQDIYQEIVAECAQFEENKASTVPQLPQPQRKESIESHLQNSPTTLTELSRQPTNDSLSVEEFVKLVLAIVKENSLYSLKSHGPESPEEILRKKRLQNNEAAARYRKRQRELREETEIEVGILENKNRQLKEQIENMQREIEQLKKEVLFSNL